MANRMKCALLMSVILITGCQKSETTVSMKNVEMVESEMSFLEVSKASHIGMIVKNADESAAQYAKLFGVEVPKSSLTEPWETSKTTYKGKPTKAQARLVFLNLGETRIELIEPVGGPSAWKDAMDRNGPGLHHIGFNVKDMEAHKALMKSKGYELIHEGYWTSHTGGCYTYFESNDKLGMIIELLENY